VYHVENLSQVTDKLNVILGTPHHVGIELTTKVLILIVDVNSITMYQFIHFPVRIILVYVICLTTFNFKWGFTLSKLMILVLRIHHSIYMYNI
jgi:hypothetical protein